MKQAAQGVCLETLRCPSHTLPPVLGGKAAHLALQLQQKLATAGECVHGEKHVEKSRRKHPHTQQQGMWTAKTQFRTRVWKEEQQQAEGWRM